MIENDSIPDSAAESIAANLTASGIGGRAPLPGTGYGSDENGLVCGFLFAKEQSGIPISADETVLWLKQAEQAARQAALESDVTVAELAAAGGFVWLHFNLANANALRWMERNLTLSPVFYETLHEGSRSTRVDFADDYLIAVLNDVLFDFQFDASHISTLVLSVGPRLLVTARSKPLRSLDRLRVSVKNGSLFATSTSLLIHLLRDQADVLVRILRDSVAKVDTIEDELLSGAIELKRANLGQLRRVLVRLKRLLAPEPAALFRLLVRPPMWMSDDDAAELRQSTEEFSVALSDIDTLQERIKLLQEEISAQVQEQNNRTLFVLTVFTVLALPVNMIAGLFGMNVGGIPLAQDAGGFWIVVTVVFSITLGAGWWMFRKNRS